MEEIQLSEFQKNIYSVIDSIIPSRQPVLVSDKGRFLVKIVPLPSPKQTSWLGCMKGKGKITGDIIAPAEDTNAWDVLSQGERNL